MSQTVLESLAHLSLAEKHQLFEILWLDLHREQISAELEHRTERAEQGLNLPLPFEQVRTRLRHRLQNDFPEALEASPVPNWQQEELLRRDRMIEKGEVEWLDFEEVATDLMKRWP